MRATHGVEIANLCNYPQHLPTLAQWHFDQWSAYYPDQTLQDFINDLQASLLGKRIPQTFIALQNGQLAGSASLLADDLDCRPELGPWLASVFIHPDFRQQGLATRLISAIEGHADQCEINTLYLFTPDQQAWYQRLGWKRHEDIALGGRRISVMAKQRSQRSSHST